MECSVDQHQAETAMMQHRVLPVGRWRLQNASRCLWWPNVPWRFCREAERTRRERDAGRHGSRRIALAAIRTSVKLLPKRISVRQPLNREYLRAGVAESGLPAEVDSARRVRLTIAHDTVIPACVNAMPSHSRHISIGMKADGGRLRQMAISLTAGERPL